MSDVKDSQNLVPAILGAKCCYTGGGTSRNVCPRTDFSESGAIKSSAPNEFRCHHRSTPKFEPWT